VDGVRQKPGFKSRREHVIIPVYKYEKKFKTLEKERPNEMEMAEKEDEKREKKT
tara:strand:- start:226 stop:387 length:162 start_codon:yes stop_codon:yes gene_type:complete